MGVINSVLKSLETGDNVRDYAHASRTFVDNNFELHPRFGNLFHVVFNFTPGAANLLDSVDKLEIPLLVKSIDLPSYTINVDTHNQYNRQVHSQHKINYSPVNIQFHDDQRDLIRSLWYKYMTFYYSDSLYPEGSRSYPTEDRYENYSEKSWGFQKGSERFFNDIKVYSMHQQKFAEYTLVNPMITSFNHSQHAYEGSRLMEHSMSIVYETVKYATGTVNNITPKGFGEIHYDNTPSPIGIFGRGPSNSVLLGGGLIDSANEVVSDLASGNILGAIVKGGLIFNNTKKADIGDIFKEDLKVLAGKVLRGENPLSSVVFPRIPGVTTTTNTSSTNDLAENIIKTAPVSDPRIARSNNSSVSNSTWFNPDSVATIPVNIGNATTIPNQNFIPASPDTISDAAIIPRSTTAISNRDLKLQEIKTRITDVTNQINSGVGNTQLLQREQTALLERYRLESGKTIEV